MAAEKINQKTFNTNYYHVDYFGQCICLAIYIAISAVKFFIILAYKKEPRFCGSLF